VEGMPCAGKQRSKLAHERAGRGQTRRVLGWSLRAAIYGILLIVMFRWFEHSQVYHPSTSILAEGEVLGRPWKDVYFTAADGVRLNGWFFEANANSPRRATIVLFCHGNGGNISHRFALYELLLDLGVGVFAFDYRGYGRSSGRPSEEGTYQDATAAFDWLNSQGVASHNIVAMGESLGGGVVAELALRRPVSGLILASTFTSIPDLGAELFPFLPVRLISSIRYETIHKLPQITAPVLVLHSRSDLLIRFHHAEKLVAAANEPKLFHEISGGHNDSLVVDLEQYQQGVEDFFQLLSRRSAGKAIAPGLQDQESSP
jgi:uncharacterized protein